MDAGAPLSCLLVPSILDFFLFVDHWSLVESRFFSFTACCLISVLSMCGREWIIWR